MKYILVLIFTIFGGVYNKVSSTGENCIWLRIPFPIPEQTPFSFFNTVPSQIKTYDKIDLSFSVNNEIVSQYRYRLEVPKGGEVTINKALITWSNWINEAFTDIIIVKISQEGRYKLTIEYRTFSTSEIRKFEKAFEVISSDPLLIAANQTSKSTPKSGIASSDKSVSSAERGKKNTPDYNKLLSDAIEKKDAALFIESIENGADINIKGINGGNIFHLINGFPVDEKIISSLQTRGISFNEPDKFGNTPLHIAIMSHDRLYSKSLINMGSDLNVKNKVGFAPLHLASFLNDKEAVRDILVKGGDINIIGNAGYTPLHISALLNNIEVAKELLTNGANKRLKTEQKLTSRNIARIQNNQEMYKMMGINDNLSSTSVSSASTVDSTQLNSVKLKPQFEVNLSYSAQLVKKRKFNKIVQIISIPVFVFSAAGTAYLKTEANNYYSLYENAENMDQARYYYDKTAQYDKYTYIAGGVSLVSLYSFIHSTFRKKSISNKMRKTLY